MVLPFAAPLLSAGAGSTIPISASSTSGDAFSGSGAINIGGLFGSGTKSARQENTLPVVIIGGIAVLAALFFLRR